MQNVRNHEDIQLVSNDKRRNYVVSEPNKNLTNGFLKNNEKNQSRYE